MLSQKDPAFILLGIRARGKTICVSLSKYIKKKTNYIFLGHLCKKKPRLYFNIIYTF